MCGDNAAPFHWPLFTESEVADARKLLIEERYVEDGTAIAELGAVTVSGERVPMADIEVRRPVALSKLDRPQATDSLPASVALDLKR